MRVPDEIRDCVVFLYCVLRGERKPVGTAFLVELKETTVTGGISFPYAVTARHVLLKAEEAGAEDGLIYLKVNTKEGGTKEIRTRIADWRFNESDYSIDAAAIPLMFAMPSYAHKWIPSTMALSDEIIAKKRIGIGDVVFYPSLFSRHSGRKRNLPILREGIISCMPEEEVYVRDFGPIEAYLIEARSMGGHSGAPVFVHLYQSREAAPGLATFSGGPRFYWLGVMHGHYNEFIEAENEIESIASKMNMGIGIVVPAQKVMEIVNIPAFADERASIVETINKKAAADTSIALDD